jgi:hypothetical protein
VLTGPTQGAVRRQIRWGGPAAALQQRARHMPALVTHAWSGSEQQLSTPAGALPIRTLVARLECAVDGRARVNGSPYRGWQYVLKSLGSCMHSTPSNSMHEAKVLVRSFISSARIVWRPVSVGTRRRLQKQQGRHEIDGKLASGDQMDGLGNLDLRKV